MNLLSLFAGIGGIDLGFEVAWYQKPPRDARGRGGWWASTRVPHPVGMADGVPDRSHRLRALGNAVVPQVAEYVGRLVMDHAKVTA